MLSATDPAHAAGEHRPEWERPGQRGRGPPTTAAAPTGREQPDERHSAVDAAPRPRARPAASAAPRATSIPISPATVSERLPASAAQAAARARVPPSRERARPRRRKSAAGVAFAMTCRAARRAAGRLRRAERLLARPAGPRRGDAEARRARRRPATTSRPPSYANHAAWRKPATTPLARRRAREHDGDRERRRRRAARARRSWRISRGRRATPRAAEHRPRDVVLERKAVGERPRRRRRRSRRAAARREAPPSPRSRRPRRSRAMRLRAVPRPRRPPDREREERREAVADAERQPSGLRELAAARGRPRAAARTANG